MNCKCIFVRLEKKCLGCFSLFYMSLNRLIDIFVFGYIDVMVHFNNTETYWNLNTSM